MIDWTAGRPTIVPYLSEYGISSGGDNLPFDLRYNGTDERMEIYITGGEDFSVSDSDNGNLGDEKPVVMLFGHPVKRWLSSELRSEADTNWWYLNGAMPTAGQTKYISVSLRALTATSGSPLDISESAGFGVHFNESANLFWKNGADEWRQTTLIGTVENVGGNYIINQFHRGIHYISMPYHDTRSVDINAGNDKYKTKTIDLQSQVEGSLTLYNFKNGTAPGTTTVSSLKFLVRDTSGSYKELAYLDGSHLLGTADLPLDHEVNTEITGLLGGDYTDGHWHLTLGEYDAITDSIIGGIMDHGTMPDVVDQTVGDDHRGNRTGAAGILEGGTTAHPYVHANGDETRNSMTSDAYIGDDSNLKSIWPSGRELNDGTTGTVKWGLRRLSGGVWTVTDATAAGDGLGALLVGGGVYAGEGLFASKNTSDAAGQFKSIDRLVKISDVGVGLHASDSGTSGPTVELANATYAVDASQGRINSTEGYAFNGTDGVTSDGFEGGIKTDAEAAEAATIELIELYV